MYITAYIKDVGWTEPVEYEQPPKQEKEKKEAYIARVWKHRVETLNLVGEVLGFVSAEKDWFLNEPR